MITFSARLREILEEKNITQAELAELSHTTAATISRYINDNRTPNIDLLNNMATALNVTTDYLIGKNNDKTPPDKKNAPLSFESAQKVYETFINNGILKSDTKLNEKQLAFLSKFFKDSKEFITFNLDKFNE